VLKLNHLRDVNEMDNCPPEVDFNYHKFTRVIHNWSLFTMHYNFSLEPTKLQILKIKKQIEKEGNLLNEKVYIPSVIDYYNLFPKFIREHPTMQMIVRGIEYYNPFFSFRTKLHMLNTAAKVFFPLEKKLNEVMSDIPHREPITLENVNELINLNPEDNRILILPDDYYTDDEELEQSDITAEMVRAWDKEEEEQRKAKKRDEGRAKRAAEEARAKGLAVPKVDKAAEEKKKEEDEIKMMEEENARLEEEKKEEEERIRQEELEKKRKLKLETSEKRKPGRIILDYDLAEDIAVNASKLGGPKEALKAQKQQKKKNEDDPDFEMNTPSKQEAKPKEDNKSQKENEKRKEKRERQIKTGRKYFEDKTEEIRSERIEKVFAFIKNDQSLSLEDKFRKIHQDVSKNEETAMHIYVSLMKSESFAPESKNFLKTLFNYSQTLEEIVKLLKKKDDERIKEYNLMMDLLDVSTTQMDTINKYAIEDMYQLSLKEHENKLQNTEEVGLKDVYVKPKPDPNYVRRPTSWQVPVDYYINDDGFWDGYIAARRNNIDVKLFTDKPFFYYKNKLKKMDVE
jgi:hypothetical protein